MRTARKKGNMAALHKLVPTNRKKGHEQSNTEFKELRNQYGLTVIQAAVALATTTHNVETWEANPNMGPSDAVVRQNFAEYQRLNFGRIDSNMLFAAYPLRVARDMLDLTLGEIAADFGYSAAAWQKFESNQRLLDRKKLRVLEARVRTHFVDTCRSGETDLIS